MVIGAVPVFDAMAVWTHPLGAEFGWSVSQLALVLTLTRVLAGLAGPLEGYLTDRVGTRRTVLLGLAVLGGSWILFSLIDSLWMFYTAYVLFALGTGFAGWIPLMTMLLKWFVRRRALVIGCSEVVGGLGAVVLVPVIVYGVASTGWRVTALIVAVGILVLAWPLTRLLRNDPRDYGVEPYGGGSPQSELTAPEALRTRAFWLISLGNCIVSIVILGIMTHLGLLMEDRGFAAESTALVVSVYTGVAALFYVVGGYAGDRLPRRVALALFAMLQAVGVLALLVAQSLPVFYLFALLFGAGMGGNSTVAVAVLADYFGMKSFGKILGISLIPLFLTFIGPVFLGLMYDVTGRYALALLMLAALTFTGALCYLAASPPKPRGPGAEEAAPVVARPHSSLSTQGCAGRHARGNCQGHPHGQEFQHPGFLPENLWTRHRLKGMSLGHSHAQTP